MKKKMVSLGLAAMMAMSLTACGGSGAEPAEDAEAKTEAAAGEEAKEGAASEGGVFKIGGIGPITGAAAAYGEAVRNGIELAVNEINEAGGVNGAMLELNFQDDENDPEKAINAYNTLKDWEMQMLVGTVTSKPCIAVAAETAADNLFQITPSGSAVESISGDNAFRICFSDPDQGRASAQYIGEHQLATKIAIIYDSSSEYSDGIRESFVAEAANQNLEIVTTEAFTADTNTDFSVQLDKAKESGAELVFLPIYYQEASTILKQASDKGFETTFFGCDGMDGILSVQGFDGALAEGLMFLTPFSVDEESSQEFVTKYRDAYGIDPLQFSADAYDAVYAIKTAAEKAGVTPDMGVSDLCDAMKTAMTEITVDGLTGAGMSWTPEGEPNKEPKAVKIENGAYVMMK
ncbi:MAG: ABC transporter substrate-binding protein [Clostridium sp.]